LPPGPGAAPTGFQSNPQTEGVCCQLHVDAVTGWCC
jgi:hypothetical protein